MNRDDIIKLAREAGFCDASQLELNVEWTCVRSELEHFAALVAAAALVQPCCGEFDKCQRICMPRAAAAEREACAKVCEELGYHVMRGGWTCAEAIRARGQA